MRFHELTRQTVGGVELQIIHKPIQLLREIIAIDVAGFIGTDVLGIDIIRLVSTLHNVQSFYRNQLLFCVDKQLNILRLGKAVKGVFMYSYSAFLHVN